MATSFLTTVKSASGDYTSLNAALSGLQNNITLSTIKVFSISAYTTPTLVAGDNVVGQTSSTTGVCVLVNQARTQILIKTISGAGFTTEVVQKSGDAGVTVTLSNTGDSPIIEIACYAITDTTPAIIADTFITNATNYLRIYTPETERHNGVWDDAKYNISVTNANGIGPTVGTFVADGLRIEGIQVHVSSPSDYAKACIKPDSYAGRTNIDVRVSDCILRGDADVMKLMGISFDDNTSTGSFKAWNNVVYDCHVGIQHASTSDASVMHVHNNTTYNCNFGIVCDRVRTTDDNVSIAKNNLVQANTQGYGNSALAFSLSSTNNLSNLNDAPGDNPINATVSFVDATGRDLRISPSDTSGAIGGGVEDPGSGLFLDDLTGTSRGGPLWDIGAFRSFGVPIAWGESTADELSRAWTDWEISTGVPGTVSGDQDWGQLEVDGSIPLYSPVIDTANENMKTFTVQKDKYATGSGTVAIYIRSASSATDRIYNTSDLSWAEYTVPTELTTQYVQLYVKLVI